ncbi:MAG: LysR family transcriptional regulator [Spirochaetaceae bacterium]|jgi:lysyl-tRNA synthetase class 2|nr:LysR family transcriptional regulator [Spirochaetaceae bacterium]
MDIELLRARAAIIRNIRRFFDERAYLEVDTPVLAPDLIPEACLEVFKTTRLPAINSKKQRARDYWLVPSPEIWMKKLIAVHRTDMYQICKCFRNCESSGFMHSPEFTMLEYYTMNTDYMDSLYITEALFNALLVNLKGIAGSFAETLTESSLSPPFVRWTMDEAFSRLAGFSLIEKLENGTLPQEARRLGLDIQDGMDDGEIYNLIFIHTIEPRLPKEKPLALLDYPAAVPCLAKLNETPTEAPDEALKGTPAPPSSEAHNAPRPGGGEARQAARTRQRWELYVNGIELANCYSEETDAEEVRNFFLSEQEAKTKNAAVPHTVDENYWKIFSPTKEPTKERGGSHFPRCSGVALGLDRLIMALTGRKTIDSVLPFPMEMSLY